MFKMPDLMKESEKLTKWCVTADSKGLIKLWHVKVSIMHFLFALFYHFSVAIQLKNLFFFFLG